jgi:hypothetical protein
MTRRYFYEPPNHRGKNVQEELLASVSHEPFIRKLHLNGNSSMMPHAAPRSPFRF